MNAFNQQSRRGSPSRPLFKKQLGPVLIRAAGAGTALLTNLVIVKQLTLGEVAYYYLYATLAYFGNAGLYVGLGVVLQRHCASLATEHAVDRAFVVKYMAATIPLGIAVVSLLTMVYLASKSTSDRILQIALCCASLSAATYLSTTGKDLVALSGRIAATAYIGLAEQVLKLALVIVALSILGTGPLGVTAAATIAAAIAGIIAFSHLFRHSEALKVASGQTVTVFSLFANAGPIGMSGLLNWLQLQSYRPALLYLGATPEIIGTTSLLTTLGSTGANPALTVTSQNFIPKLYAGESEAFRKCIKGLAIVAFTLAALSAPAAIAFIMLSGRHSLLAYVMLVPMGVLVEAGNSVIGAFMHRQNANERSMWVFAVAGALGTGLAGAIWMIPISERKLPYLIGLSMLISQAITILIVRAHTSRSAPHRALTT